MSLHTRIKEARSRKKITQTQLGDMIGVAKTTIAGYEKNREPTAAQLGAIADALDVDVTFLLQDEINQRHELYATPDEMENLVKKYRTLDSYGKEAVDGILDIEHRRVLQLVQPEPAQEIDADNIIELPLMFSKASAGRGFSIIEAPEEAEHIKIMYNQYTRKADFCVRVAGRSMEPKIYDGDIVLIRDQPAVDVNEIGLFTVDDLGYIKKMGPDRLISINPDFDDIFPEEYREVRCYGKFIAVLDPEWIIEDID